jgi:two-component system response regulator FixJ
MDDRSPPPNTNTVYVVENNLQYRLALTAQLESLGFTVRSFPCAETYQEFITKAPLETIACALVDWRLGAMNGLQLLEAQKGNDSLPPLILMSGYNDTDACRAALLDGGAVDWYKKTSDQATLTAMIRKALDKDHNNKCASAERADAFAQIQKLPPHVVLAVRRLLSGRSNIEACGGRENYKTYMRNLGIARSTLKVSSNTELIAIATLAGLDASSPSIS